MSVPEPVIASPGWVCRCLDTGDAELDWLLAVVLSRECTSEDWQPCSTAHPLVPACLLNQRELITACAQGNTPVIGKRLACLTAQRLAGMFAWHAQGEGSQTSCIHDFTE